MSQFDVVAWMATNGIPGYANKIKRYASAIELTRLHNRRGGADKRIAAINRRIEVVRREAADRYDDWRSDPLD